MSPEHFDVVIVGAGLSGIGAAYHLQRSPTYVVARPASDAVANWLRQRLPAKLAYGLTRWKNVLTGMFYYRLSQKRPEAVKQRMVGGVQAALGSDCDVAQHFTPAYKPWDQRVCLVPDGDFFAAIRSGKASVVTDQIACFTAIGIRLKSGAELVADVVVSATGLVLQVLGGLKLSVDGHAVDLTNTLNYKGMMYSEVPNLASCLGYTNASWTLKVDLTSEYVCRLLNHLDQQRLRQCTPRRTDPTLGEQPWTHFSSGYVQRSLAQFPKHGSRTPWRLHQNYARDLLSLRFSRLDDGEMVCSNPAPLPQRRAA